MKNSLALIQPTLFEGGRGGGSVWDAISLGVSSIVSDIEPNLEIKEENMLFFKTKDENDLALKMEEIIKSPKQKATREQLIEKSQKNAKKLNDFLIDLINQSL
jgi:glycosyltransferase involved in cell wall biosynthesis